MARAHLPMGDTGHNGGVTGVEIMTPRDVPLGGPRAMRVRRTLPQRERSLIGAWCFVDHYGPDDVADTGGMSVAPHPHTGLQTVSWLFSGEVEHRDSAGNHAMVRPGEVNLMTAGRGISHSEVSPRSTTTLHGAQLWVALPDSDRNTDPGFAHHAPAPVTGSGWTARVLLGSLLGDTSPVPTYTPLLGAELVLEPGTTLLLDVDATFEHGVLVDAGVLRVAGTEAKQHELAYVPPGPATLDLEAHDGPVRLLLLGGPPLGESIVMWWNFVGRSHEEIVAFRAEWQEQILDDTGVDRSPADAGGLEDHGPSARVVPDGQLVRDGRFGIVTGDHLPPIPAPPLPNARLKRRPTCRVTPTPPTTAGGAIVMPDAAPRS
jgi:redox-sensitive bicupin YhaK (pirin superfamily)